MSRLFFITGTDTNVGKTIVTAALLAAFQDAGFRCAPVKPVQSGAQDGDDDLAFCLRFAAPPFDPATVEQLRMHRLPLPASPHLAARVAGITLDVQSLEPRLRALSNQWNVLLVEGAGGLLVPLNDEETMLDLITNLGAEPILVARDTLGTLNHTLLSIRALATAGLKPAAIVLTSAAPPRDTTDRLIREDNLREISRRAAPVPVVHLPFLSEISRPSLLAAGRPLVAALMV